MAEVVSMRIPESVYFFSTKQYCEEQRSLWLSNGTITDPKELK